jgi:hypothetical protein
MTYSNYPADPVDHRPTIEFCGEIRRDSAGALLVFDGANEVWIPKSQIKEMTRASKGGHTIVIPEWLAKSKGII